MTRFLIAAALTTGLILTTTTAAEARHRGGPLDTACRFQLADGHPGWSVTEVKRTIRCAVHRWSVPGGLSKALYIAHRESRYHQHAYNPSGCSGVYQWAAGTWASILNDFPQLYRVLSHDVFNARSNVLYAIKYAHNRGWQPWGG